MKNGATAFLQHIWYYSMKIVDRQSTLNFSTFKCLAGCIVHSDNMYLVP